LAAKKSKEKTRAGALFDLVLRAERVKQDKELAEHGEFKEGEVPYPEQSEGQGWGTKSPYKKRAKRAHLLDLNDFAQGKYILSIRLYF